MNRTSLYDLHQQYGAKLVPFAGWEMPLYYTSIAEEHVAVRTDVGLFDVSHMGEIRVTGEDSLPFLQFMTLNDPAKLRPGRGQYSMLPNDTGGLIDDLYVYRDDVASFLVVCNAANRRRVLEHLTRQSEGYEVHIVDESDSWDLLALQGPGAVLLLARYLTEDLTTLKKNQKVTVTFGEHIIEVARTGYTGEDGFEIFCRPESSAALWQALTSRGAKPCGLGARDTLRLEAGFPLFGHEFSETTNPRCSDYAWVVKDKPFFGREAMWEAPCTRQLVGLRLAERGVARQGYRIVAEGRVIGEVTSGTISPFTRESIALGWVDTAYAAVGTALEVEIRGQPKEATVVKPPFY
jgi:aminomethyltransferase